MNLRKSAQVKKCPRSLRRVNDHMPTRQDGLRSHAPIDPVICAVMRQPLCDPWKQLRQRAMWVGRCGPFLNVIYAPQW
jgi:hypothetical protein